jgi:hypothetical protein
MSDFAIEAARKAAVARQTENAAIGRKSAYGHDARDDLMTHIVGCRGELVVARMLDLEWCGKGTFRGADVGPYQVRSTQGDHRRKLILHKEDPDNAIFWLATSIGREFVIHGFARAGEQKLDQFWEDPTRNDRYAWFVPHHRLCTPSLWKGRRGPRAILDATEPYSMSEDDDAWIVDCQGDNLALVDDGSMEDCF